MDVKIIALLISSSLYWYFNLRSNPKCIVIQPKCNGIKCYIAMNKSNKDINSNNIK